MKKLLYLILFFIPLQLATCYSVKASIVYSDFTDYNLDYGDYKTIHMFNGSMITSNQNDDVSFYGTAGMSDLMPEVTFDTGAIGAIINGGPVKAFNAGQSIGPGIIWSNASFGMYINESWSVPDEFPIGVDKYIGVKIDDSGDIHYGWILVEYESVNTLIIKSCAYETDLNTPIITGDTGNGGTTTNWIEVRADNEVNSVLPGGSVQMRAYVMPDDIQVLNVDWSVINGTGSASISSTGVLTGINEGMVTVNGDAVAFTQLAPGSKDMEVTTLAANLFDITTEYELDTYPNPANEVLNIEITSNQIINGSSVTLTDLTGKALLFQNIDTGELSINVEDLTEGIYILHISRDSNLLISKRIVIQ